MKKFVFGFLVAALLGSLHAEDFGESVPDSANLGEIAEEKLVTDETAYGESPANPALEGIFVGVDVGLSSISPRYLLTTGGQQGTQEDAFSPDTQGGRLAGEFGLKFGLNFTENHRLYLGYRYQSKTTAKGTTFHAFGSIGNSFAVTSSITTKAHKFVLGYDFLMPTLKENRTFVGPYLGFGLLKSNAHSQLRVINPNAQTHTQIPITPSSKDFNFVAFIIGLNAGHTFKIYGGNELEIGVRTEYLHGMNKKSSQISSRFGTSTIKSQAHSFNTGIYAAYRFNFDF